MSRSGNVWDNSVMESVFSTMKIERCHRRHYATRQDARADIFDCIERLYNTTRRHSTLGNVSPVGCRCQPHKGNRVEVTEGSYREFEELERSWTRTMPSDLAPLAAEG